MRKGQARQDALRDMDRALQQGSAADTYAARDRLVAEYADLATDAAVVERLTKGNDLLRQAVTFDPSVRPAELGARPEPLGPPLTYVLRSSRAPATRTPGAVVFALAEGIAYGLAEADGAPLWQRPVGPSAPFPPQPVAGAEPSALVVDARSDELLRLDARTGAVRWRLPLEEPATAPPLVLGNDLFQAMPGGDVLKIDLASGAIRGTFHLGKRLTATPTADELGQHLYVLADQANLFVLTRDPPSCVRVEYLGHESGSIACAPVRIGKYLVVPINDQLETGHWRVFLLDEEGARPRLLQRVPVPGWTWSAPATAGSVVWATGDQGGLTAYAIGAETESDPFRPIARYAPENQASGPVFALARSERDVWVAGRLAAAFRLSPERGRIDQAASLTEAGAARGPIQNPGRWIVLTQQAADGRGVALWGVAPADGTAVWTTILGAPWPVPPRPSARGEDSRHHHSGRPRARSPPRKTCRGRLRRADRPGFGNLVCTRPAGGPRHARGLDPPVAGGRGRPPARRGCNGSAPDDQPARPGVGGAALPRRGADRSRARRRSGSARPPHGHVEMRPLRSAVRSCAPGAGGPR